MIRRSLFLILVLVCSRRAARAQDVPKAEVFGGFSILATGDPHLKGWQASVAGNLSKQFSIVGEVTGQYADISGSVGASGVTAHQYSFLAGPRVYVRTERADVFTHVLVGSTNVGAGYQGVSAGTNGFQMATGGGVDVKTGGNLRIRVVQADLLTTHLAGQWGSDLRLSFGVVIAFGKK